VHVRQADSAIWHCNERITAVISANVYIAPFTIRERQDTYAPNCKRRARLAQFVCAEKPFHLFTGLLRMFDQNPVKVVVCRVDIKELNPTFSVIMHNNYVQ
jgi:hypothetical protein